MTSGRRREALVADARTNEQLAYDLIMDVWRAGAQAEASDVFGARQPGVRMIVVADAVGPRDAFGRMLATGHLEDGGDALPGSVIDRNLCAVGSVQVVVDAAATLSTSAASSDSSPPASASHSPCVTADAYGPDAASPRRTAKPTIATTGSQEGPHRRLSRRAALPIPREHERAPVLVAA